MFAISPIDLESLSQLKPLLDRSAGYEVDLQDEVDHFKPDGLKAQNTSGQVLGFIRSFDFEPTFSLIEFYVDPDCNFRKSVGQELFKTFQKKIDTKSPHRWRVDLLHSDTELNQVVQDLGFPDEFKVFRFFETRNLETEVETRCLYQKRGDPLEAAAVLSFLSPVSEFDVYTWMAEDQIRILKVEDETLCVMQVFFAQDSAEIVRFSTKPQKASKGFGSEMIHHLKKELIQRRIPHLYLKVEDSNEAAIHFYRKHGFEEKVWRKQYWYSKTT